MNYKNCGVAATHGQLDALKWLRSNGCKWNELVVIEASRHKHSHILKWAIENGCPHDVEIMQHIGQPIRPRNLFENPFMDY
jgi:hypothetical protein